MIKCMSVIRSLPKLLGACGLKLCGNMLNVLKERTIYFLKGGYFQGTIGIIYRCQ